RPSSARWRSEPAGRGTVAAKRLCPSADQTISVNACGSLTGTCCLVPEASVSIVGAIGTDIGPRASLDPSGDRSHLHLGGESRRNSSPWRPRELKSVHTVRDPSSSLRTQGPFKRREQRNCVSTHDECCVCSIGSAGPPDAGRRISRFGAIADPL